MTEMLLAVAAGMLLHEFAHAFMAEVEGDELPRMTGRLTLNPLAHIHPIGTIGVPALTTWLFGVPVGWMRAMPLNPRAYTRAGLTRTLLAGPFANLALALALAVPGWYLGAAVNIYLAAFNFIPIGTTDGARLLAIWRGRNEEWRFTQGVGPVGSGVRRPG